MRPQFVRLLVAVLPAATCWGIGHRCPAATGAPATRTSPPSTRPAAVDLDAKVVVSDHQRLLRAAAYWMQPGPNGGRDKLSEDQSVKVIAAQRRVRDKYNAQAVKPTAAQRGQINEELARDVLATMTPAQVAEANAAVEAAIPTVRQDRERQSASHLHVIGLGILLYQQDHQQHYPPDLASLVREEQLPLADLTCPGTAHVAPANAAKMSVDAKAAWAAANCDYTYIRPASTLPGADLVICYETADDHEGRGTAVLYGDGRGVFLPTDQAERQIEAAKSVSAK